MIIAVKEKDRVVVGFTNCDVYTRLADADYIDEENVALKFNEDGVLFGCASMDRRSDVLLYDEDFTKMEINPKSIVREVIPYIKHTLKQNDLALDKEGGWKNALIICKDNHIYSIGGLFNFYEAEDYMHQGYRRASIENALDENAGMSAEERIIDAVRYAGKMNKENLFPLVITDTKTKKFKYIMRGDK